MSKQIKARIIHKHDIEANWALASSFVPMLGEEIIYDADDTHNYPRIKIGDGKTPVTALPFISDNTVLYVAQALTNQQKAQARNNIDVDGAILDMLVDFDLAPVFLNENGDVLTNDDGTILMNT